MDSAVHDIDLVNWLVGEAPRTVYATGSAWDPLMKDVGDFDTSVVTLTYPSGAIGTVNIARNISGGYDQRVDVRMNFPCLPFHNSALSVARN